MLSRNRILKGLFKGLSKVVSVAYGWNFPVLNRSAGFSTGKGGEHPVFGHTDRILLPHFIHWSGFSFPKVPPMISKMG